MIDISIQIVHSTPCVKPEGRIDTVNSSQFEEFIQKYIDDSLYFIIDLSQCNYLSSSGIRILLKSLKKMNAKNGKLLISGITPEVFQVLKMAGLHQIFHFFDDLDSAKEEIIRLTQNKINFSEWTNEDKRFHFYATDNKKTPALLWKNQSIAGYNELMFSIGIGSPAETLDDKINANGLFITTGNCAGFVPFDNTISPDFRLPQNPNQAGIMVNNALSFAPNPTGIVRLANPETISLKEFANAIYRNHTQKKHAQIEALLIANFNIKSPTISFVTLLDKSTINTSFLNKNQASGILHLTNDKNIVLWGVQFELNTLKQPNDIPMLHDFINESLNFENIVTVKPIEQSDILDNPICWILSSENMEDANSHRIAIEVPEDDTIEPYKIFLARRLYQDSMRVVLKKLHGGYSAQTYQVESFDKDGRKLRPTVLKFANRAMITREASRCQQYSLPYILNNSAIVLGTEFFGDCGALCYNFVGIGGEETQLKWLTHYFLNWPIEKLEPLFDKTFLQILKPWYGQPVNETIYPFRDHDPTFTFFPHIYETASKLFSISSDDEFFTIPETGQKLTNPYWFLKHEYEKYREYAIDYKSSICHGDLNMQNILLDQDMNVYLIDFSETRPRSIVSDFARLEAIFTIEYAPIETDEDLKKMLSFANEFYNIDDLSSNLEAKFDSINSEFRNKNLKLTYRMRDYAFKCSLNDKRVLPYYIALLEWIMPVICYNQLPIVKKRYAMIVSALLCEKLKQILEKQ